MFMLSLGFFSPAPTAGPDFQIHILTGRAGQAAGAVGILIGLALLAAAVFCWHMLPE